MIQTVKNPGARNCAAGAPTCAKADQAGDSEFRQCSDDFQYLGLRKINSAGAWLDQAISFAEQEGQPPFVASMARDLRPVLDPRWRFWLAAVCYLLLSPDERRRLLDLSAETPEPLNPTLLGEDVLEILGCDLLLFSERDVRAALLALWRRLSIFEQSSFLDFAQRDLATQEERS